MMRLSLYTFLCNRLSLLMLTLILASGCETVPEHKSEDCKYGKPISIFSSDHSAISNHTFKIEQSVGIETVSFTNGVELEIQQSGCNHIVQNFKFRMPGKHHDKSAEDWVQTAINQLRFLGGLDEKYAVLSFWGNEIEALKSNIKLGAVTDIKEGFKVKIDKVLSINYSLLEIELSQ